MARRNSSGGCLLEILFGPLKIFWLIPYLFYIFCKTLLEAFDSKDR